MDEKIKKEYERWLKRSPLSNAELEELKNFSEEDIVNSFIYDLKFGTAGLRGIMGLGINRMNKYVIRRATQAMANYIKKGSVAIAYDSRNNSRDFALEAATVLAANGITAHIYKELMPTPSLSYAVRYLHCDAGINVTASHNPKMYNGYKVYGSDGCQMTTEAADAVYAEIQKIDIFDDVKTGDTEEFIKKGLIKWIDEDLIQSYYASTLRQSLDKSPRTVKLVYTPLNGAGLRSVTTVLERDGFKDVMVVPEQRNPDGNFTTCPYPNPEFKEALQLGINLLLKENRDLLIATDPDSDRCACAVNQNGEAIILTGNEVAIVLLDYIYHARKLNGTLPEKPFMVKTVVSTDMVNLMCKKWGIEYVECLTGFKWICSEVRKLEETDDVSRFIFGFEESCGYVSNPEVRDKDGVNACMLLCEAANLAQKNGQTLYDRLQDIYKEFGDFKTATLNFNFQGINAQSIMDKLMEDVRRGELEALLEGVDHKMDILKGVIYYKDHEEPANLPSSNVIKYWLPNHATLTIRPSGTEPKLKAYIFAEGMDQVNAYADIVNKFVKARS